MSSYSKLERVFKSIAGVPYAGHPVTVTEANSNTWVRLYTREGSLICTNGETFTDENGRISVYVQNDRPYELNLRHKVTRFVMMTMRSEETTLEDVVVCDPALGGSNTSTGTSVVFQELFLVYDVIADGAVSIPLVQTSQQISLGHSLFINGLFQSLSSYTVTPSSLVLPASLSLMAGDQVTFEHRTADSTVRMLDYMFAVSGPGETFYPLTITEPQISMGTHLYLNGLLEHSSTYDANTSGVAIHTSMNSRSGDQADFLYSQRI